MRANIGDVLVVAGSESRSGLIIGVVGQDGAPPYVIKWLSGGHIAMVTPESSHRRTGLHLSSCGRMTSNQAPRLLELSFC